MDVLPQSAPETPPGAAVSGKTLPGFLLSGFLMALPGALLPVWGFYRDPPAFGVIGNYFLSLAAGMVASVFLARRLLFKRRLSLLLVVAAFPPLISPTWRNLGLAVLGLGAGLFNFSMFHSLPAGCSKNPAAAVNRAGIWYGLGCLAAALSVALTLAAFPANAVPLFLAILPVLFVYLQTRGALASAVPDRTAGRHSARLENPAPKSARLFALLLFFQFGNEWSIAGWLSIFLIRRIGFSPEAALRMLALYWLFLLLGRLAAVAALPRVHNGALLGASVVAALFGCLLLYFTNNGFGAVSGVFLLGSGYSSVYPLTAGALGHRFSYYRPAFFGRIFSFATLGGLLAPALIGYAAARFGVGVVIGVPLVGTCLVLMLIVSIWIESRFAL